MTLNMQTELSPELRATIGKPKQRTPEEIRSLVLNSVGEGFNTMRILKEKTGLTTEILNEEIRVMNGLYIVVIDEPIESYWLKSRAPKGKIVIENGRAVEIKEKKSNPKISKEELIAGYNEKIRAEAEAAENDLPEIAVDDGSGAGDKFYPDMPIVLLLDHKDNPRGPVDINDTAFTELVDSIRAVGIQEPLVVTPIPNSKRFRVVIGHRRKHAALRAGHDTVPCIVRRFDSPETEDEVMLIENIQRENLKPTQEARAFEKIYNREGKDLNAVARKTGITQGTIKNRMKLLLLDIGIQIMVDRGEIGVDAGTILARLDHDKQKSVLPRALRMKSGDLRDLVSKIKAAPILKARQPNRAEEIKERRVTTDEEKFTRSGALRSLDEMGDGAWVSVEYLKRAFDDVCVDSCLETKDETICNGCPVPRFVHALKRHKRRGENQ